LIRHHEIMAGREIKAGRELEGAQHG
jgi:hypothetical protein